MTPTLWSSVHDAWLHLLQLVLNELFLVLLLLQLFPVKLHLNVLEFSGDHVHRHVREVPLDLLHLLD